MSATPADDDAPTDLPWRDALKVYLEPASLRMLALGFAAGLPLLLVLGTLSFRLREAGIDRTTIGFLSWVGLAYGFKWIWAPLVDRLPLPPLTTPESGLQHFRASMGWGRSYAAAPPSPNVLPSTRCRSSSRRDSERGS